MKTILLSALVALVVPCSLRATEPVLAICHVIDKATDDTREMVMEKPDHPPETCHVEKKVIVSDKDVSRMSISLNPQTPTAVVVQLTAEGDRKMHEATRNHELKRLAIILDGKLVTAPALRSEIGGNFIIEGLSKEVADHAVAVFQADKAGK